MPIPRRGDDEFRWHVSSYSPNTGGNCVEAGSSINDARIAVRDSKYRAGGYFTISPATWTAFVRSLTR